MKKIISVICAAVLFVSSFSVSAFALSQTDADTELAAQNAAFEQIMIDRLDVNGTGKIEASDARAVLLASAGLSTEDIKNAANADIDKDGSVTAIDARIFLRLAANLESVEKYLSVTDAEKLAYFKAVINSIKPYRYKYYQSVTEETTPISHDNQAMIDDMNEQVEKLTRFVDSEEEFDFGEALLGAPEKTASTCTGSKTATERAFPVSGNELACLSTLDNIKKIDYKVNQTYTFKTKVLKNGVYSEYTDSMSGLSSLTIYLKDDPAVALKETGNDLSGLNAATAIDVLDDVDIQRALQENQSSVNNIKNEFGKLGAIDSNMIPTKIRYHDAYVTVYFNPENGQPVGVEYNQQFNLVMNMYLYIDISVKSILEGGGSVEDSGLTGSLLYVKDYINIESETKTLTSCYFYNNNPNAKLIW